MSSKKTTTPSCSQYQNPLCILYGSATGNSEHIAKDLTKYIQSNISMLHPVFDHVICCELDQYKKVGCLALWERDIETNKEEEEKELQYQYRGVLIICSTTGNGDAPENASRFVRHMKKAATAATHPTNPVNSSTTAINPTSELLLFRNVCYAVLGLGDTNYDQFCAAAVTIDRALHQLGGHKCILYESKHSALTCADEGSGQLEDVVEPWVANIIPKIVQACCRQSPPPSVNGNTLPVPIDNIGTTGTSSSSSEADIAVDTAVDAVSSTEVNPAEDKNDTMTNGTDTVVKQEDDAAVALPSMASSNHFNSSELKQNGNGSMTGPTATIENSVVAIGVQMVQTILLLLQEQDQSDDAATVVDPDTLPASLLNDNDNESATAVMKPFTYIADIETETINENEVYSDVKNTTVSNSLQQRIRGMSIGSNSHAAAGATSTTTTSNPATTGMAEDSVSSVSAGYYYTVQNPYPSQILQARYLTNTSTIAAQQVVIATWNDNHPSEKIDTLTTVDTTSLPGVPTTNTNDISDNKPLFPYKDAEAVYDAAFPLTTNATTTTNEDSSITDRNGKRVIEMTLSLPDDSTLEYSPGDSLGILFDNPTSVVEYVANLLQQNDPSIHDPYQQMIQINYDYLTHHRSMTKPISVIDALSRHLDLCSTIKNKRILFSLSLLSNDVLEQQYLQLLSSKTNRGEDLFRCIIDEQRMNVVDVIQLFPSVQSNLTLEILFQLVPNFIPPRYYSVSSSPLQPLHIPNMNGASNGNKSNHTNYLTIAFSVVDYITPPMIMKSTLTEMGRRRVRGVATRYLEAISSPLLCSKDDTTQSQSSSHIMDDVAWPSQLQLARIAIPKLRIFPKPTMDFRMPQALSTPLILIGPGTGIAPFIGFLRHRQAVLHQQSNTVVHSKCDDSHGIYSTTVAAKTVVEGTWRGGYELENDNELAISQQDESGLNVGADFRMQSNHAVDYGSVDVLFGCRHQNHDWLYKDEMDAFVQDGIITKLYVAFSRDEPTNTNHRRYVQDIILNDSECGKRFIDLMVHQDAVVYVCGDGNSMAQDVQSAIITLLASSQFQGNRESGKAYLDEMKRKQRFLMDIWS